ncbi:hypothetical protein TNCV_557721 [Trichonephila clavipes]|nr:hypothetical protein TNCV_557721 [Trichonephila clavipes]
MGKKVPDEIVQMYLDLAKRGIKVQKEWDLSPDAIQFNYFMRSNLFTAVSSEQKVLFLNTALWKECLQYNDFLFYISNMANEDREALFKISAPKILQLHLDWPLQDSSGVRALAPGHFCIRVPLLELLEGTPSIKLNLSKLSKGFGSNDPQRLSTPLANQTQMPFTDNCNLGSQVIEIPFWLHRSIIE